MWRRIADFLFEAGMLKRTPRTGYQFLGSGKESVAEHLLRASYLGYVLARLDGEVDGNLLIKMCLFHDLPEARTGDLNYVNKKYVAADEPKAIKDLCAGLPFGEELAGLIQEFNAGATPAARLAYDADQLALILELKELGDLGNPQAAEWIEFALRRLRTKVGRRLAAAIVTTDSSHWWFADKSDYWVNGKATPPEPPPKSKTKRPHRQNKDRRR